MKKKILFVALLAAICVCVYSCAVKANSDDDVLVVQDVSKSDNGSATITFRNSNKVLNCNFEPTMSSGSVLLIKPDGQYVVLAENNHFDSILVLVMIIVAFLAGCLITGRYVRKCLEDDTSSIPED